MMTDTNPDENPAFQDRFEQTRETRPGEGARGGEQTEDTEDGIVDDVVPVDPATDGTVESGTRDEDLLGDAAGDAMAEKMLEKQTVDSDGVAGETVFDGDGPGGSGPGGSEPVELAPEYAEHDEDDPEVTLLDETPDAARPDGAHATVDNPNAPPPVTD